MWRDTWVGTLLGGQRARERNGSRRDVTGLRWEPGSRRDLTLAVWERYTEWPLVVAALVFLATYGIPIIWPDIPFFFLEVDADILGIVWGLFIFDFLMRFLLATNRRQFFRHNLIDFFSLLLPMLRPLRILRLLAALSALSRFGMQTLRRQVMAYTVGMVSTITFVSALAVTSAERGAPGSNIHSFGDGIWWAFVTLTTVGYGDMSPVTVTGRAVGIVLMVSGVLLLGVIAATLASWLVQHGSEDSEGTNSIPVDIDVQSVDIRSLDGRVSELVTEVNRLTQLLEQREAGSMAAQLISPTVSPIGATMGSPMAGQSGSESMDSRLENPGVTKLGSAL